MANTKSTKKTTAAKTVVEPIKEKKVVVDEKNETKEATVETIEVETEKPKNEIKKKKDIYSRPDLQDNVEVTSCVHGTLIYRSKNGMRNVVWGDYGDTEWLTVSDLMDIRNTQKSFFAEQWIRLTSDNAQDVIQFLNIGKYYVLFSEIDNFDEIFDYSNEELVEVLSKVTPNMKENIARRAYVLINEGIIDSKSKIDVLEEVLGYPLSEKE